MTGNTNDTDTDTDTDTENPIDKFVSVLTSQFFHPRNQKKRYDRLFEELKTSFVAVLDDLDVDPPSLAAKVEETEPAPDPTVQR